jgi:hypothetical protein
MQVGVDVPLRHQTRPKSRFRQGRIRTPAMAAYISHSSALMECNCFANLY